MEKNFVNTLVKVKNQLFGKKDSEQQSFYHSLNTHFLP